MSLILETTKINKYFNTKTLQARDRVKTKAADCNVIFRMNRSFDNLLSFFNC